jgi:integrase
MANSINRLTFKSVQSLKLPGMHADGAGLYLRVTKAGSKQWVFVFHWRGRRREMGLGGFNAVSLARAREKAAQARAQVADEIDPIIARDAKRELPTFGHIADEFVVNRSASVRSDKSVARLERILSEGGYLDALRPKRVDHIDVDDVLGVLKPIWTEKADTAAMVRGYIENVLDAARAKGFRHGENPARWKGHLDHLLPARKRLTKGHHAAIPFVDLPDFLGDLRANTSVAARGLEFLILTAARSGEVFGATWSEMDLPNKVWTVPASRMKAEREHRVPLSDAAIKVLGQLPRLGKTGFILPGAKPDKPLSNMAFSMVMRRLGYDRFTVHGMRSAFRDWAGDATAHPREVIEAALAHTLGDQAELAYRRSDALDKRRVLMNDWAAYCGPSKKG